MRIFNEKVIWTMSLLGILIIYIGTYYFDFYSPRGYPLKPLFELFSINDFGFYKDFALNYPYSLFNGVYLGDRETFARAPIIFSGFIYMIINIFQNEGAVSPFFVILIMTILLGSRLYLIRSKSNIEFPYYLLISPYFFYFTIFPSSDMLMSVLLLPIIFISVNYLENQEKKIVSLYSIFIICSLVCMTRAQGFVFMILPLGLAFYSKKELTRCNNFNFIFLIVLSIFMIGVSGLYYIEVLLTYLKTSQSFLVQENMSNYSSSIFAKFFSSFGLRESFQTVYAEGIDKPKFYQYVRLILGLLIFLGFLICIYQLFQKNLLSIMILIIYAISLIAAIGGVSFERYFLTPNFFFFHIFLRSVERYFFNRYIYY